MTSKLKLFGLAQKGKDEILVPERNLKWQKNKVRPLGIFSSDPETALLNQKEKIEKIRTILSNWG